MCETPKLPSFPMYTLNVVYSPGFSCIKGYGLASFTVSDYMALMLFNNAAEWGNSTCGRYLKCEYFLSLCVCPDLTTQYPADKWVCVSACVCVLCNYYQQNVKLSHWKVLCSRMALIRVVILFNYYH